MSENVLLLRSTLELYRLSDIRLSDMDYSILRLQLSHTYPILYSVWICSLVPLYLAIMSSNIALWICKTYWAVVPLLNPLSFSQQDQKVINLVVSVTNMSPCHLPPPPLLPWSQEEDFDCGGASALSPSLLAMVALQLALLWLLAGSTHHAIPSWPLKTPVAPGNRHATLPQNDER